MSFPVVDVEGSAHERGLQYGSQAAARIHESLDLYMEAFRRRGLDRQRVEALASAFVPSLQAFDSELLDELRGIAEGAELELEHVVALNARTELLYGADSGCTAAACLPEVTATDGTLLGQNWDWRPGCRDSAIVLRARPEAGPRFATFVEAGLLARCGMNSAGIGVVGNYLQSADDFGRAGVPIPFVRRKILMSETLAEALGNVLRTPRAFSSNHLVADAAGEAVSCEVTPDKVFFVHPEGGILEHANHFRSPAAAAAISDVGVNRYPDSLYRDRRIRRLLERGAPRIGVEDLQAAFRDHYGLPNAVCRHLPAQPEESTIVTVASVIMDLSGGAMWVARGPVCESTYTEIRLD